MLSIILIIYFLILLKSIKLTEFNEKYLSIENTKAINGFFVLLVFLSHFSTYVSFSKLDFLFLKFKEIIGQLMVSTFLFYSGYGIMKSILKKKDSYVNKIPKNRFLKSLLNFDIAIILYLIVGYFLNTKFSLKQILLSLIGYSNVGNSNWYIFIILILYLLIYISYKLSKKDINKFLLISTILSTILILVLKLKLPSYFYNTIYCFILGLYYANYEDNINNLMKDNSKYFLILTILINLFLINSILDTRLIIYLFKTITFILILVFLSMKISLNSKILSFFGNHIFSIYILQRIPMKIFISFNNNVLLYFSICFIITIVISCIFDKFTLYINNKLFKS